MRDLGIDFGRGYTKIAILDESDQPKLDDHDQEEVPSPVSSQILYSDPGCHSLCCIGDKADILLEPSQNCLIRNIQNSPPESDHWVDYFRYLLTRRGLLFENMSNASILLPISSEWYNDASHPGPKRLKNTFEKVGYKSHKIHFQEKSVCAAAYFKFKQSYIKDPINLLIIDIGYASFETTLIHIDGNIYRKLFQRVTEGAGRDFDVSLTNAACQAAYSSIPKDKVLFERLVKQFEAAKIDLDEEELEICNEKILDYADLRDTPVYQNIDGQYKLNVTQVWQSFMPFKQKCEKILEGLKVDPDYVYIIGGFSQYPLVKKYIIDALSKKLTNDFIFNFDPVGGTALGACLMINGIVKAQIPYEHTIGLVGYGIRDGMLQRMEMPLILADQAFIEDSICAEFNSAERLVIQVKANNPDALPIFFKENGGNQCLTIKAKTLGMRRPPAGQYTVEYTIDRFRNIQLSLINKENNQSYPFQIDNPIK